MMANTSPLTSRPREKQLSIRLDSVEKFSVRLVASGAAIKKNKKGLDNKPQLCYNKSIKNKGDNSNERRTDEPNDKAVRL